MDSILTSVKRLLGIQEEYEHFDPEIIMHINDALMTLTQLGIGPPDGFFIEDSSSVWTDFVPDNVWYFGSLPTYVYQKVKLVFDIPTSSAAIEAIKQKIAELEWRLQVAAETNPAT